MSIPHFKFGSSTSCTYCGDSPDTVDHIFAVSSQTMKRRHGNKTCYGPITPCCSSCNVILSNRGFDTFLNRCEFVNKRLESKAKPIEWSKAQMQELDYTLRTFVEKDQAKRLWYRFRADWFKGRDWVLNLESLTYQPAFDVSATGFNQELFDYFESTISLVRMFLPEWNSNSNS